MTEAERARLTDEWFATHMHEWEAWDALPMAEQKANLDKIDAAGAVGGPLAARQMGRALGMPFPPDELADPVEVLEARKAEGDQWTRDMLATHTKLTQAKIDDLLEPAPVSRVDH